MSSGAVVFGPIPRLPESWWESPGSEWTVWDPNAWYVWGANVSNYAIVDPGTSLGGSGLAGTEGPTRGRGHPRYVGVITTSLDAEKNDAQFQALGAALAGGGTIVIPAFKHGLALGAGYAVGWFAHHADWYASQRYLLGRIRELMDAAAQVSMPAGTSWVDAVAPQPHGVAPRYDVSDRAGFDAVIALLDARIG